MFYLLKGEYKSKTTTVKNEKKIGHETNDRTNSTCKQTTSSSCGKKKWMHFPFHAFIHSPATRRNKAQTQGIAEAATMLSRSASMRHSGWTLSRLDVGRI